MKTKLLIFGITGDLSTKKLLPALEQIIDTGEFDDLSIIGVSRHDVSQDEVLSSCQNRGVFNDKISFFTMDVINSIEHQRLCEYIALQDDEQLLIYLAVPPQAVAQIMEQLGHAGLNESNVKILFEKPFGVDLESAQEVNYNTSKYYKEEQIYRIDHYLAKEMAQNIVTIRNKNALFSQIWDNRQIESIAVIASETIGIEGRANFYEQTGALRDVVQGHLMQLLALTLMDIPPDFNWDKLPKIRIDALNQLMAVDPRCVIRAQYDGYREEVGNPDSSVETFVSMDIKSNDERWRGVPIKLITGKYLSKKTTEIRIHLKKTDESQSNCLIFSIQPNEGVGIELLIKKPGYSNELEVRRLGFNYPSDTKLPDAYEQVLVDAISSRKSLFTSSEEVLQSWRIIQPIQDSWKSNSDSLRFYPKGVDLNDILA